MGGDTLLCTRVGNDTNGEELSQYLYAEGVDTRFMLSTDGETTGLTIHLCEYNVAERRMIFGGAGAFLSAKDVEDAFMSYPDAVILQGDIPTSALAEASRVAKMRELPLFLLSLPQDYDGGKLPVDCEILSVDDEQILRHTGIRPSDQEKCMKACLALSQIVNTKYVVLRLHERGCFLFDGKYYHFFTSYDVAQPLGVQGNESFTAALVLEYLRSEGDVRRACEFATVVNALYLTKGGGFAAYPTMDEIRRFVARNEIDLRFEE
jgi:ribokinase